MNLLGPRMSPPRNIFAPYREGRVVGVTSSIKLVSTDMYKMFHAYDVDSLSSEIQYTRNRDKADITALMVSFATRREAEEVVQVFDGYKIQGHKLLVKPWQLPRKFLGASWDGGRGGGHFSGRDQGSAVGTKFESVSLSSTAAP